MVCAVHVRTSCTMQYHTADCLHSFRIVCYLFMNTAGFLYPPPPPPAAPPDGDTSVMSTGGAPSGGRQYYNGISD